MDVLIKTYFFLGIGPLGEDKYVGIDNVFEIENSIDLKSILKRNAGKIEIFSNGQDLKIDLADLEYLLQGLLKYAGDILENRPFSISLMLSELETLYGFPVNDELFALERTLDEEDYPSFDVGRYRHETEHLIERVFLHKRNFILELCKEAANFIEKMKIVKTPDFGDWWIKDIEKVRGLIT